MHVECIRCIWNFFKKKKKMFALPFFMFIVSLICFLGSEHPIGYKSKGTTYLRSVAYEIL